MGAVLAGLIGRLKTFWPMLVGIICARTGLIIACYGSYAATDDGIFTDGAMLVTCLIFIVALLLLAKSHHTLGDTTVQWMLVGSVIAAAASSVALSVLDGTDPTIEPAAFGLSIVSTLALSLCMFYWLRCLRGTDEVTAALFVFDAFMVSVALVYFLSFLPTRAQNIIGAVLIVSQLALLGPAALREGLAAKRRYRRALTFFTFARSHMQDTRFLAACTLGMGLLSFVDGFLRGYPDGLPIPFTPATRLAYSLAAIVACASLAAFVVRRRERVMTVGIFLTMEALATGSLVLFGAFPFQWEIGAVLVNTLNIVICAYCWYVIIAFTRFGNHDPYFYAMGGWVVCFGPRSVARMMLHFVYPLTGNDLLINSLIGALILLSTQVVLMQFLLAEHREGIVEAEEQEARAEANLRQAEADVERTQAALDEAKASLTTITQTAAAHEAARVAEAVAAVQQAAFEAVAAAEAQRCIKCTDGCSPARAHVKMPLPSTAPPGKEHVAGALEWNKGTSLDAGGAPRSTSAPSSHERASVAPRQSSGSSADSMRTLVQAMGEQFLLSDREIDVLALYARGYTQKKVAEELSITPATAHSHIKRIYAKCGMHSRQEILEYLNDYPV